MTRKKNISFQILIASILFASCNPHGEYDLYRKSYFKIDAKVANLIDSIMLGDSVAFIFEIPDTIILNNNPTYLSSKEYGGLNTTVCKVDSTVPAGYSPYTIDCKIYSSPGNIQNNGLQLARFGSRLWAKYYMIPQKKGVYFLWCNGAGYFDGNDGGIKSKVSFDFDVSNKHHDILKKAAGGNNNLEPMISSNEARGQGIYAFAVK